MEHEYTYKYCSCDVCENLFIFGPQIYEGKKNQTYNIFVCDKCNKNNMDGWAKHLEENVTKNLKAKGLPLPQRNDKDLLPLE